MIAFSLVTAGGPDDFPPHQPVTISISALARHFGVSRGHVRKWLTDAADGGYIARSGADDSAIAVLPPLHAAVENFFGNAFLFMRDCARRAFDEVEAERNIAIGQRA
jgi:DNA-binding GntR family transcriptional regulator